MPLMCMHTGLIHVLSMYACVHAHKFAMTRHLRPPPCDPYHVVTLTLCLPILGIPTILTFYKHKVKAFIIDQVHLTAY
jgi:hypothetical protein